MSGLMSTWSREHIQAGKLPSAQVWASHHSSPGANPKSLAAKLRHPIGASLSALQILIKRLIVVAYPRLLVLRQSHLLNAARLESSLHERKLNRILLQD